MSSPTVALRPREQLLAEVQAMNNEEFVESFIRLMADAVQHIWLLSAYVADSERRGVDLRKVRNTMIPWLRQVWEGTMRPEVIGHFIPKERLIGIVGRLPIEEQLRLSDDDENNRIPVVVEGPDPTRELYTTRMVDPLDPVEMTPKREQLAIDYKEKRFRTPKEQEAILDEDRRERRKPVPTQVGPLTIDRERKGAYCGKTFIHRNDLEQALACLRSL